jgi:GNAT superfamily N-acetyltransferase
VTRQWQPTWWTNGQARLEAALELYRAGFTNTLIPDERILALLDSGIYRLTVVEDSSLLVGIALLAVFSAERFAHLDYIVTRDSARRRGVASAILLFLQSEMPAEFELLTLETSGPMGDFYGRRGALRLQDVPYLFPGLVPVPEDLLAFPLTGARSLPGSRVGEIIRTLYREIHGRPADDPLLAQVIAQVPPRVSLTPP